ncbi:MAG: hypothetical protein IT198_07895 [Acidimicrobiia bacterium]|nr:hypothetical protein [Acidimicrobiia bacterium]
MTIASASQLAQTALAALTAWDTPDRVQLTEPLLEELASRPDQTVTYLQSVLRWAGDQHGHDEEDQCLFVDPTEMHDDVLAVASKQAEALAELLESLEGPQAGEPQALRRRRLGEAGSDVVRDVLRLVYGEETCALEPHLPPHRGLTPKGWVGSVLHAAHAGLEVAAHNVGENSSHLLTVLGLHTAQMAGEIDRMARRQRTLVCQSTPTDSVLRSVAAFCREVTGDIEAHGAPTPRLRPHAVDIVAGRAIQSVMAVLHLLVSILSEEAAAQGLTLAEVVDDLVADLESRCGDWRSGALPFLDVFSGLHEAETFDTTAECAVATIADDDPGDILFLLCAACAVLLSGPVDLGDDYYDDVVEHAAVHRALLSSRLQLVDPHTCDTLHAVEVAVASGCLPDSALTEDMRDVWFDAILVYAHLARLALEDGPTPSPDALERLAARTAPAWFAVYGDEGHLREAYAAALDLFETFRAGRAEDFVDAVTDLVEMDPFESLRLMRDVAVLLLIPNAAEARHMAPLDVLADYFNTVVARAAQPQLTVDL